MDASRCHDLLATLVVWCRMRPAGTGEGVDVAETMEAMQIPLTEQVPLAPLTTLGIGGPARYFLHAESEATAIAGIRWARDEGLPLLLLGGGSNILISDDGFPGLVLRVGIDGLATTPVGDALAVTVGAGMAWDDFVTRAVRSDWAGVECMAGIPGLVGGTPIQNVGAYGQEVADTIASVDALDMQALKVHTFSREACAFGYRDSRFRSMERGRYLILRVTFLFRPGGAPRLFHAELERYLAQRELSTPSIAEVRAAVLEIRARKSMLWNPDDPNARSAGSFFVNPIMTPEEHAALQEQEAPRLEPGQRIPYYPTQTGLCKVPAAWLIEQVGFNRGHVFGNVGLSAKHTLALINRGGASARDVIAFAREIRTRVYERFGILLSPEPIFIGVSMDAEPQAACDVRNVK